MDLDSRFQEAAEKARQLPSQSNESLLKIYGLFKQAAQGDVSGPEPGTFNFKGKAKYDAWTALKGTSREQAKQEYIALIEKLGNP